MKKYKLINLFFCAVLLLLELLPAGAVLFFASESGESIKETYAYFSLVPYGYANYGPFLTAVLTVILTLLTVLSLRIKKSFLSSACTGVSALALITSLMPLIYGTRYITLVGIIISALLLTVTVINIFSARKKEN